MGRHFITALLVLWFMEGVGWMEGRKHMESDPFELKTGRKPQVRGGEMSNVKGK